MNLADQAELRRHAWRYVRALLRVHAAAIRPPDQLPAGQTLDVADDNEAMVEQMRASMAVGW